MVGCELTLSGAPSCRGLPGCLWGFPCLVNGYVVLVASLVLYLFDVAVDCLVFVVNCMLVCQKRLILILILILILVKLAKAR